jgi:hypothetical protein
MPHALTGIVFGAGSSGLEVGGGVGLRSCARIGAQRRSRTYGGVDGGDDGGGGGG